MEKRSSYRKSLGAIQFQELTTLKNYKVLIEQGYIVDASINGFLIEVKRDSLFDSLKDNLTLDDLLEKHIALYLPQMEIDLDGYVKRTRHTGNGDFELYIEFSEDVPDYWRDCLVELLPSEDELEDTTHMAS